MLYIKCTRMIEDMASGTLLLFLVCGYLIVNSALCCNCDYFYRFDCKSLSVSYIDPVILGLATIFYSWLFILKGIILETSHSMEMRDFTSEPITLISKTALKLKLTGRFREQMEKQRCTLCWMKHIGTEDMMTFLTEGSVFMESVIYPAPLI